MKTRHQPAKGISTAELPEACSHHSVTPSPTDAANNVATVPDATYTCPMHRVIKQDQPGSCPKCGMSLEPVMLV